MRAGIEESIEMQKMELKIAIKIKKKYLVDLSHFPRRHFETGGSRFFLNWDLYDPSKISSFFLFFPHKKWGIRALRPLTNEGPDCA